MNASQAKNLLIIAAVAAGITVAVAAFAETRKASGALANVNEGTPYEGFGVVGTLGHAVNAASGGIFQRIGERIGGAIYNATH